MEKDFKLSDLPKRNIHQVPEGYFDRLPMRVMARTAAAEERQPLWLPGLWRPLRQALAPLVLLLVFVGVYFLNAPAQPGHPAANLATVSDADIVNYLNAYVTLETDDFAELRAVAEQEMTADFLNVSPGAAEEELEYYHLEDLDY